MRNLNTDFSIIPPRNQLYLFGYENYFRSFIKLHLKNELPNTILLSGPKGSGKATFIYHFINFLLSHNEENKYSVNNFTINPDNKSYKRLCDGTHPNFASLEIETSAENIKIENVRSTLKFLNKSTFSSDIKIVLIDNVENLNKHSSNALLKSLEEGNNKTFFFIIHNNSCKISDTIKSRCIEFKFFFTLSEKKVILENILEQYKNDLNVKNIEEFFYFDTPGNIIKYLLILNKINIDPSKDKLSCILHLVDKYKQKNDTQLLTLASLLIELFYNDLSISNKEHLNFYSVNKFKLLKKIDDTKRFNLDKKNLSVSIRDVLENA